MIDVDALALVVGALEHHAACTQCQDRYERLMTLPKQLPTRERQRAR